MLRPLLLFFVPTWQASDFAGFFFCFWWETVAYGCCDRRGGSPHISRPCEVSMGYWSGALLSSSSDHVIKILPTAMSSVIVESAQLFDYFRYTARITSGVLVSFIPSLERDGVACWLELTANFVCDSSLAGIHLRLVVCARRIRTFWRLDKSNWFHLALSIFIQ